MAVRGGRCDFCASVCWPDGGTACITARLKHLGCERRRSAAYNRVVDERLSSTAGVRGLFGHKH